MSAMGMGSGARDQEREGAAGQVLPEWGVELAAGHGEREGASQVLVEGAGEAAWRDTERGLWIERERLDGKRRKTGHGAVA